MKDSNALLLAALLLSCVSGCASKPEEVQAKETLSNYETVKNEAYKDNRDPLEGINRVLFDFNYNVLDKYVYRPTTIVYIDYVPDVAKEGVNNLIRNLDEPSSAVNNLLQTNWQDSATNVSRFLINSTIGVVGLMDVASHMGLRRKLDTFGEVMGVYGVSDGPYLMLPVMGPSSVREEVGDYVDELYWPLSGFTFWPKLITWGFKGLYARAQLIEQERLLAESLDPYAFVKEAYFQYVRYEVYDGKPPEEKRADDTVLDDYLNEIDN